jgi:hypothetical protein
VSRDGHTDNLAIIVGVKLYPTNHDSFCNVYLTKQLFDSFDSAEETGKLEIYNDYDNERIMIKGNRCGKSGNRDFVVV